MSERAFAHHGTVGAILRLSLFNLLLNIVTLSLWRFWGKTRVRSFLWGHTTIWGEPLEYVGRGAELFIGFLLALIIVFLPYAVLVAVAQMLVVSGQTWGAALIGLAQLGLFFLIGIGLYRARRYLMTRTVWRSLRAGLDGSALVYALLVMAHLLLLALTLGWSGPWMSMTLERYVLNHTRYGQTRFVCDATSRGLYPRFALVWFSFLPVLASLAAAAYVLGFPDPDIMDPRDMVRSIVGWYLWLIGSVVLFTALPLAAYHAAYWRIVAAHTRFDGIGFDFRLGTWRLIRLFLGNAVITLFSFGILRPWTSQRTLRAVCDHLDMERQPDLSRLFAGQQAIPRTGEGLVAVLDGVGEF